MKKHFIDWTRERLGAWIRWGYFMGGLVDVDLIKDDLTFQEKRDMFEEYIQAITNRSIREPGEIYFLVIHVSDVLPKKEELEKLLAIKKLCLVLVSGAASGVKFNAVQHPDGERLYCHNKALRLEKKFIQFLNKSAENFEKTLNERR